MEPENQTPKENETILTGIVEPEPEIESDNEPQMSPGPMPLPAEGVINSVRS